MRPVLFHSLSPCACFLFGLYLFVYFFPEVFLPGKIYTVLFVHRVDYVTAKPKGIITQRSVIKIKNSNREHGKVL